MGLFKKFFSKKEEINDKKEEIVDNRSKILFHIHDVLSKLELINFSHGETLYLTDKIAFFHNELDKIEKYYVKQSSTDISLQTYDNKLKYLVSLSILADELDNFSKTYFYLEDLDVLRKSVVSRYDLNEKIEKILELDSIIQSYHDPNEELDTRLHDDLIDVIFTFLKKEVELNPECELYDKLSVVSRLMVNKKYLEELVRHAKNNLYIQEYLDNNDIEDLSFDYSILAKMEIEDKSLQETSFLCSSRSCDLDDDDIEKLIDKFQDKMNDAMCVDDSLSIDLGYADFVDVAFKIIDRSKKLDYDINSFQIIHKSKKNDDYYYFVVSDGENIKNAIIVGLLFIDFRKKISSYEPKLYLMSLRLYEVTKILSLVENDSFISSSDKLIINRIFSNLYEHYNYYDGINYDCYYRGINTKKKMLIK